MWSIILSIIVSMLEKVGLRWLIERKEEKTAADENKVISMSDAAISNELRDDWQRK